MNGIIPLYKEKGMTSGDCVYKLRKILHERHIGHTGTLDPDVDGVLVICVGQATKLVNSLMNSHKIYRGEATFGYSTTTEDSSGDVLKKQAITEPISDDRLDNAMNILTGDIVQTPPMYSAVRVNGKRLYEYAREGIEVERPSRKINVYHFNRLGPSIYDEDKQLQKVRFEVECSKGTYIRTLAVQLGELLSVPSHMSQLTRTYGSFFGIDQTVTLDYIQQHMNENNTDFLMPIASVFSDLAGHELTDDEWQLVQNGNDLSLESDKLEIALFYHGVMKAIYLKVGDVYRPKLMLLKNDR